jgi:hypothetical protein
MDQKLDFISGENTLREAVANISPSGSLDKRAIQKQL